MVTENIARKRRKLDIDGGNAAATRDEFMFPPSTALWKKIADGRTLLPEFSLASMMAYFVTRKVSDGQNAGDFKHLNNHSYPLFKSGHFQKILTIKGNDNNVYLNAVCLPEMRKDREYKIQMVLSPSAEICTLKMAAPREEDLLGAVNVLRPFAMHLRSLSD